MPGIRTPLAPPHHHHQHAVYWTCPGGSCWDLPSQVPPGLFQATKSTFLSQDSRRDLINSKTPKTAKLRAQGPRSRGLGSWVFPTRELEAAAVLCPRCPVQSGRVRCPLSHFPRLAHCNTCRGCGGVWGGVGGGGQPGWSPWTIAWERGCHRPAGSASKVPEKEEIHCAVGWLLRTLQAETRGQKRRVFPGDALVGSLSQKWIRPREMKDDLAGIRD